MGFLCMFLLYINDRTYSLKPPTNGGLAVIFILRGFYRKCGKEKLPFVEDFWSGA